MKNKTKQKKEEAVQETQALIKLCKERAETYAMLSRLYLKELDQELVDRMQEMLYPAASGNENVDKGYLLIATYLSNLWKNSVSDLAIDYARTFIGHGVDAYSAAYPYESVYTSPKRLLMQNARDEVRTIYLSQGLDKQKTWKEGEDHIALELEFMKILCQRSVKALANNDEKEAAALLKTQKNFLEQHLIFWVPMMTADIRKFTKTDMYLGLAYLSDGFLVTDNDFLIDLLDTDTNKKNSVKRDGTLPEKTHKTL